VKLKVNKMTSTKTLLPLDYYSLPFCRPENGVKRDDENLGEILSGDRIENSPYYLQMKVDMYCEQLCTSNLGRGEWPGLSPNKAFKAIRKSYNHNWIVDNMSSAGIVQKRYQNASTRYAQGFPVGFINLEDGKAYVHNHVNIEIMYHAVDGETDSYRVVRFLVEPFSIKHNFDPASSSDAIASLAPVSDGDDFSHDSVLPLRATITNPIASCDKRGASRTHTTYKMVTAKDQAPQPASGPVLFTYDVTWTENKELNWASRWDIYLTMDNNGPDRVHWMSIAKSLIIVVVLSAMIVAILVRNLHLDITRYNRVATNVERSEEENYGWKLVHADVFRPPSYPMILAVACGTGAQLLCMTFLVIFLAALGFMSPARRGHLLMMEVLLFAFLGGVNGYVTARLYKTFKGKSWQRSTTVTAVAFPGFALGLVCIMNVLASIHDSTSAVPFTTILILIYLWSGISLPLVFLGGFFGYKQEAVEFPVNTSSIPRQIPDQSWLMRIPFTLAAIGGILPFDSCFVELYYILASVWLDVYYYVFGFLFLVFVILMITCAEITVLLTYFQLCREDYHWWWRSFSNAGSTAIYVFLYSFVYFKFLEADTPAAYVVYFGYMGLVSSGLFLMMGCVGVLTSLWFNKTLFASMNLSESSKEYSLY
jgi:transmembrane 9 superfamily member 2/4